MIPQGQAGQAVAITWNLDPAIQAEVWRRLSPALNKVVGTLDPSAKIGHVFNHLLGFKCPEKGQAVLDQVDALWAQVDVVKHPTFEAFIKYVLDANALYASDMKKDKPVTKPTPRGQAEQQSEPQSEHDKFFAHWKNEGVSEADARAIVDLMHTDWNDKVQRDAAYHAVGTFVKERKAKNAASECARQLVAELGISYDDVPKALAVAKMGDFGDWNDPSTTDKALTMVRTWKTLKDADMLKPNTAPATDMPTTALTVVDSDKVQSASESVRFARALITSMKADRTLIPGVDYGEVPGTNKPTLLKPGAEKMLRAYHLRPQFEDRTIIEQWQTDKPLFVYRYECQLFDTETGALMGSGIGSCNSMESKYASRWVTADKVPAGLDKATLPTKDGRISEPDFAIKKGETTGKYGHPLAYWEAFRKAIADGTAVKGEREKKDGGKMPTWEIGSVFYSVPNTDIFSQVNTIDKMAQKRALVAATLIATNASEQFTQDMEDYIDAEVIE